MDTYHIKELNNEFKSYKHFTTNNVVSFYHKIDKNLKRTIILNRISVLIEKGVIQRIGKGLYCLGQ
ncbi:MAG: hypothetical protein U9Q83_06490, partial [Bacteroidota bacterium]|nr:hypothetical protein [Bacteroidota bacterium]